YVRSSFHQEIAHPTAGRVGLLKDSMRAESASGALPISVTWIDGAKALRAAINKVFGTQHPVQRCRNHKIRNVCDRLPEEQKDPSRRRCAPVTSRRRGKAAQRKESPSEEEI